MTVVTVQLLAMCLCLRCKLGNELWNLRASVARILTQSHVTLPWDHMTKNHTHEGQTSCCAAGLQPSNHIIRGVPGSEHLGSSDYYNCKDRVKDLATPSQSSLEGSDWDSEVMVMRIINYVYTYAGNFCTSHVMSYHIYPLIYMCNSHHTPHSPYTTLTTHHTHHTRHSPHITLTTHHTHHKPLTTHHTPH